MGTLPRLPSMTFRSIAYRILGFYGLASRRSINWERIVFAASATIFMISAVLYWVGVVP